MRVRQDDDIDSTHGRDMCLCPADSVWKRADGNSQDCLLSQLVPFPTFYWQRILLSSSSRSHLQRVDGGFHKVQILLVIN